MKKGSKFAIGAMIAGGVGYLAGILTAPKSGKETRQDIHDGAVKLKNDAENKLKELSTELNSLIAEAKALTSKLGKEARDELQKLMDKATNAKKNAHEVISAFHEGESEDKDLQKAIKDVNKAIDHLKSYLDKHA
jgi:gas vesicle protein